MVALISSEFLLSFNLCLICLTKSLPLSNFLPTVNEQMESKADDGFETRDDSYKESLREWQKICEAIEKSPAYVNTPDALQASASFDFDWADGSFGIFSFPVPSSRRQQMETDDSRCDTGNLILTEEKVKCRDLCQQCFPQSMAHCEVNYDPNFTKSLVGRSCSCTYGTYYDAIFRDGPAYSIL